MSPDRTPYIALTSTDVSRERFGAKAHILSRLTQELLVPTGYALDLAAVDRSDLLRVLEEIHGLLASDGSPLIVRSSAYFEDAAPPLYPGRFASLRDLESPLHLYEGVQHCIAHVTRSARVKEYERAHRLQRRDTLASVVIQHQIPAHYAGVVFTASPRPYQEHQALIEFVQGAAAELLAGNALGALYGVDTGPPAERYVQRAGPSHRLDELTPMLEAVMRDARRIERLLGEPQDIEWVWKDDELYIVQARPARMLLRARTDVAAERERPPQATVDLASIDTVGQKAAAEYYFGKLGCGAANATVIPPKIDDAALERTVVGRRTGSAGTVIRFSHLDKAGLPVAFVSRDFSICDAYKTYIDDDREWAAIISDYVFVEHAFEAYLDEHFLIVEHVPGNWEPQNELQPDVFVFEERSTQAWRCKERRRARYELPSAFGEPASLLRDVNPIADRLVLEWIRELPERFSQFRHDLRMSLPLNFHFVRAGGRWHFLNIRPTRGLRVERSPRSPSAEFKPRRFFLVTRDSHLDDWDGVAPILLTLTADEPAQASDGLATLARSMREMHIGTVYTTFGVLSHPALVLREFGLNVEPLYDRYDLVLVD